MRVAVIGGGLTGLATVHELRARDIDVCGFEATDEPGGVIRSRVVDGTVIEYGPQRLRLHGIVEEYLAKLDLIDELQLAPADLPIYVYGDGRLSVAPFDPGSLVRTDLISWPAKARLLLEPLTGPAREDDTVATYFTRKLGPEAYRAGIEPLFGGLYGSDPAEMPVEFALAPIVEDEVGRGRLSRMILRRLRASRDRPPAAVPIDGMQTVPQALYDRHNEYISLGTSVDRISRTDGGFEVGHASETEAFDSVIVATDAPAAANLLGTSFPDIAESLASLNYNRLAMVYLEASIDHHGLGYQVRRDEGLQTLGVSWNGVAFGRGKLHTAFFGGMHAPEMVDRSDSELGEIAVEEFETVLDVTPEVLAVHRLDPGMPAYDHSWNHTEQLSTPPGLHLIGNYTARVGIPGRLRQARTVARQLVAARNH